MASRFYTVLVLPDATARTRIFHLTRSALTAAGIALALGLVAFVFLAIQYVNGTGQTLEMSRLRAEAERRGVLLERVEDLERQVADLRSLDARFRSAAGIEAGKAPDRAPMGVGGVPEGNTGALAEAFRAQEKGLVEQLAQELEQLNREIAHRQRSFRELKEFLESKRSRLASTPTIWPVRGWLTSGFGNRVSPFTGQREMHDGIDIASPIGTPVRAAADGIVTFVGALPARGNVVFVEHGHGFATFYGHNSTNKVREGQRVKRGDIVAYVGSSGRSTGPHLHFGVQLDGKWVDPRKYIVEENLPILGGANGAAGAGSEDLAPPKRRGS